MKKIATILSLIFLAVSMLSGLTSAQERTLNVSLHGQEFRGEETIYHKKEIMNQHPDVNLRRPKIAKITLVAKSRRGRETAALRVGQEVGYEMAVDGTPRDFGFTLSRATLENDTYSSRGAWQILLRGAIKVKEVIVILKSGRIL